MDPSKRIADQIRRGLGEIGARWRESRGAEVEEEAFSRLAEGMDRLTVAFTEFLRSPESVEGFSRGGATHALVREIAGYQHELGRDAVGVIEDFAALRRSVWRSVEERVDLSAFSGGEVAGFFTKMLQAADWVTEEALASFDAIVREEMGQALGRAASTDLLTGLPDRDLFSRLLLPQAVEERERFSMVIFDVARFSETVASGEVGRARDVLRRLTDAVREAVSEEATCVRFGDDEICALLPEASSEDAYHVAERVLQLLSQDPGDVEVHAGVAEYPTHGRSAGELTDEMLGALKVAKRVGGNGIVVAR
jgi:diguanylate cyclase (GGDEF)-like protein